MKTRILVSLFWMCAILAGVVQAQSIKNISKNTSHATIQSAINLASSGDIISIPAGTYTETLNLGGKALTIQGSGINKTIINARTFTGYAIQNFGNSSIVKNLTLKGTTTSYGFKIKGVDGITLENIKVDSSYRTGIDLNTVTNAVLNNVEVKNTAWGFGLMILNSHHITVTDIATSGNAWGGVSVQTSESIGTDDVMFSGNFNVTENLPLLLEEDPYSGNYSEITNVSIPDKLKYEVYNLREKENPSTIQNYKQWYFFKTYPDARTYAGNAVHSSTYTYSGITISNIDADHYFVSEGMKIQDAVDAAFNGDLISVGEGTFTEQVRISKNITLEGEGKGITKIVSPSVLATSFTTKKAVITAHDTSFVVIQNLTVDGAGLGNANYQFTGIGFYRAGGTVDGVEVKGMRESPANGTQHGVGVYVYNDSGVVRNVTVKNCVIHDYQKGGIVINEAKTVGTANNNIVTGLGPVSFIAQNGIQFGFGASGTISSNTVTGNVWTGKYSGGGNNDPVTDPNADASAGILAYMPGTSITITNNSLATNQFGVSVVAAPGVMPGVDIHNNTVTGLAHTGFAYPVGIGIWSSDQWTPGFDGGETATTANIQNNTIINHDYGIVVFDYAPGGAVPHAAVHRNAVVNSNLFGAWSNVATNVAGNWWGTGDASTIASHVNGSVVYAPWWGANYVGNPHTTAWTWGTNGRIQVAIDSAAIGDIVQIAAGTYNDSLLIGKRITLSGTVSGSTNLTNLYPLGDDPLIEITGSGTSPASPLKIRNLNIYPNANSGEGTYGVMFRNGVNVSNIEFSNVRFTGTNHAYPGLEHGIYVDMDASVSSLKIDSCYFTLLAYGMDANKLSTSTSTFSNLTVANSTFDQNISKGLYFEKLSNALIQSSVFSNNGDTTRAASWAKPYCSGVDINLKYGNYSNIVLDKLNFVNNGIGSLYGTGLTVKARGTGNDPSYSSNPATLDAVSITGCVFQNNTAGIRFTDPGTDNVGPSHITINKNSFAGSAFGLKDFRGSTADTIDATGNWWSVSDGPNDNAGDGTMSYVVSDGGKLFELTDKKIAYAPWYANTPDDNASQAGVNQQGPKVFRVKESVPYASKGYINRGIQLASLNYVDTIDVRISGLNERPAIDRNVFLKFLVPPTFDSLIVSEGDLELSTTVTISGSLNLTNGNIVTNDTNRLVFDTTAFTPVETDTGRIIGVVEVKPRKVGKGQLKLLGLEIQPGDDDLGKIGMTRKSGADGVVTIGGNSSIGMTWKIEADHQPTGGREVKFRWPAAFDNGLDVSSVYIYRNNGSGWTLYAGPLPVTGNPREVGVTVTGFSSWTVGSAETPVPVQLASFTAAISNNVINLSWKTATEVNNHGFEIERKITKDAGGQGAANWKKIAFVEGAGTSNAEHSYSYADNSAIHARYAYRLKQIDNDGTFNYSQEVEAESGLIPRESSLSQNYPNPFNPSTVIDYQLAAPGKVSITVYDMLGREVAKLVDEQKEAGYYSATFGGLSFASGIYYSRFVVQTLDAPPVVKTIKMQLIK